MIAHTEPVDARFPSAEDCVVGALLERRAREHPERVFAILADEDVTWTYADVWREARSAAVGLSALGVKSGDRVLVWLPNGSSVLRIWFGCNLLGATYVPINIAYRGNLLEHVVRNSGASVIVVHASLVERLHDVALPSVTQGVVIAGSARLPDGLTGREGAILDGDPDAWRGPATPVEPWHEQLIIYTSGTTGPSKGVLCSYIHQYETVMAIAESFGADDRSLVALPLYHAAATLDVYASLLLGGSFVVVPGFSTAEFWPVVREHGVNVCTLLGTMARFLLAQPPDPADHDNPLRTVFLVPLTADAPALRDRFDLDIYTVFNMTEISAPLVSERNPTAFGSCGRGRPGVQVRLVDEYDCEVAVGEVGELIVRTDLPWAMNHGYNGMPEATAEAWRNGWFHTGDVFRRDAEGNYYFIDRKKDAIRRRGENISSFEVEAEVAAHPAVLEVAAVAVPSEHSEDEVLVALTLAPGAHLEPLELVEFLVPRMPYFMVPRFIRVLDELPKTPTAKVEKYRLRQDGATGAWDREAAGIHLGRAKLRA